MVRAPTGQACKPSRPQVVQCCVGKFHHFDLARQFEARGMLSAIYTGYPWWKLRHEGLARSRVRPFPWLQTVYLGRRRLSPTPSWIDDHLAWWAKETLDAYCAATAPACDVLVGLSGAGLRAGRRAQERGGKFVCDRGSTHIRVQEQLLREEFSRWQQPFQGIDPRTIHKEEQEYHQADAITVPSEFARRSFLTEGLAPGKVHRIAYGVDLSSFQRCANPNPTAFEVLFVGSVSLRKGVPYLLQAFAKFRHPGKRLRVVGAVAREVQDLLFAHRLDAVEFLGAVPQRDLPQLMSSSHVLVLPSVEEGLALVQAQAMACACPVIASENTGARDLFQDGSEGFIVPIRDPLSITERLEELAQDAPRRQEMSAAALRRVTSIGGWDDYGERFASLCGSLCAGSG